MAPAYKNRAGFTLIEVVIAMFILLIGMLALLNTAAVVIDHNLQNIIRDEATNVVGETMTALKNTPFNNLTVGKSGPSSVTTTSGGVTTVQVAHPYVAVNNHDCAAVADPSTIIPRTFRDVTVNYCVTTDIEQAGNANTLTINVTARWSHKGNLYERSIMSVVNNAI